MNELASRYSLALYSLSEENKVTESFQLEIKMMIKAIKENPEFIKILNSSFLSKEERKEMVNQVFQGMAKEILYLVYVLIDNDRIGILEDVLFSYNSLVNEKRGIKEGFVYSTEYLKSEIIADIEKATSQKEKMPVELKNLIDTSLIGGVKVVINDHVYDGSIKNRLEKLKTNLIHKEGE